jgi:hypothetical protein
LAPGCVAGPSPAPPAFTGSVVGASVEAPVGSFPPPAFAGPPGLDPRPRAGIEILGMRIRGPRESASAMAAS